MTVKTDDVTKGRKDLDPHGSARAVTGGSGANGLSHEPVITEEGATVCALPEQLPGFFSGGRGDVFTQAIAF